MLTHLLANQIYQEIGGLDQAVVWLCSRDLPPYSGYSCHAIEIPGEKLPPSRSKGAGPALNGYSALPKEYLVESVIKAHTIVAAPGYTVKEGRAAMGEYNHFLTVQKLIDLVVFLKQGTKAGAK